MGPFFCLLVLHSQALAGKRNDSLELLTCSLAKVLTEAAKNNDLQKCARHALSTAALPSPRTSPQ
jgi:hypothetical protein